MDTLADFLGTSQASPAKRREAKAAKPKSLDMGSFQDTLRELSGGDEFTEQIVVGFLNGSFKSAGLPGVFRTSAELERDAALATQQRIALEEQAKRYKVESAIGQMLDNPDLSGEVSEALGRPVKIDRDLVNDPDTLLGVSRVLAAKYDMPELALTNADLLASPLTRDRVFTTQEDIEREESEEAAKDLRTATGAQEAFKKDVEFRGGIENEDPENPVAQMFSQRLEAAGESMEADVSPGVFGSELDEIEGARAFVTTALQMDETVSGKGMIPADDSIIGTLLRSGQGKEIIDQLNQIEPDEEGKLSFRGNQGLWESIDPNAVGLYMALLQAGAERSGQDEAGFLAQVGLGKFTGLNIEDIAALHGGAGGSQ